MSNQIRIFYLSSNFSLLSAKFLPNIYDNIVDVHICFLQNLVKIEIFISKNNSKAYLIDIINDIPQIEECLDDRYI